MSITIKLETVGHAGKDAWEVRDHSALKVTHLKEQSPSGRSPITVGEVFELAKNNPSQAEEAAKSLVCRYITPDTTNKEMGYPVVSRMTYLVELEGDITTLKRSLMNMLYSRKRVPNDTPNFRTLTRKVEWLNTGIGREIPKDFSSYFSGPNYSETLDVYLNTLNSGGLSVVRIPFAIPQSGREELTDQIEKRAIVDLEGLGSEEQQKLRWEHTSEVLSKQQFQSTVLDEIQSFFPKPFKFETIPTQES